MLLIEVISLSCFLWRPKSYACRRSFVVSTWKFCVCCEHKNVYHFLIDHSIIQEKVTADFAHCKSAEHCVKSYTELTLFTVQNSLRSFFWLDSTTRNVIWIVNTSSSLSYKWNTQQAYVFPPQGPSNLQLWRHHS